MRDSSCGTQGRWVDLGSVVQVSGVGALDGMLLARPAVVDIPFMMALRLLYIPVVECGCLSVFMFLAWVWICRYPQRAFVYTV